MSEELRGQIRAIVVDTAPELEGAAIGVSAHLLDEVGLDSMDFLDLVTRVYEATGVNIPEEDYAQVDTIDKLAAYVAEHR